MTKAALTDRLTELLQPEAEAHGFELVAVEQVGGRGMPVIRVLLDREGGVNIDAIASANVWVSELIDSEDPTSGPFTLEVSSPGIDRPLTKPADFERFSGEVVKLKYTESEKRTSVTGTLVGIEGDDVTLEVDGQTVIIPFDTILKARLKGAVDFGKGSDH